MDSSEQDHPSAALNTARDGDAPAWRQPRFHTRLDRVIAEWRVRARGRRLLAEFDERMLRDIGIDPARVWQETGKWFWQP